MRVATQPSSGVDLSTRVRYGFADGMVVMRRNLLQILRIPTALVFASSASRRASASAASAEADVSRAFARSCSARRAARSASCSAATAARSASFASRLRSSSVEASS